MNQDAAITYPYHHFTCLSTYFLLNSRMLILIRASAVNPKPTLFDASNETPDQQELRAVVDMAVYCSVLHLSQTVLILRLKVNRYSQPTLIQHSVCSLMSWVGGKNMSISSKKENALSYPHPQHLPSWIVLLDVHMLSCS